MPVISATWEVETEGSQFKDSQGSSYQDPISKTRYAWWCMPVFPAIQEVQARESLFEVS
jgi:hypothetical protein